MKRSKVRLGRAVLLTGLLLLAAGARAQAPHVIQFFMPDGSLPPRELRFTLVRDDGRTETLFTDSKGKFPLTGDLVIDGTYTVTVRGDGQTFGDTSATLRLVRGGGVTYTTVFLRPREGERLPPASVVNVAELDKAVPAAARESYERGMAAAAAGDAAAAVEGLRRAVELYPAYARALNDLGVLYIKLGRLDEAAESFRGALRSSPRFAHARLNLGIALNRQGKHRESGELLGPLYKESPQMPGVGAAYADALDGTNDLAGARKVLERAIADTPGADRAARAELHYKFGRVLSRQGRDAESVEQLLRSVELAPEAANAQLLLGGGLLQLKRWDAAERALLRAYELGGASVGHAQLLLGQLYFERKDYARAARAFEQYLADVPRAENAGQIRELVAKLKALPRPQP